MRALRMGSSRNLENKRPFTPPARRAGLSFGCTTVVMHVDDIKQALAIEEVLCETALSVIEDRVARLATAICTTVRVCSRGPSPDQLRASLGGSGVATREPWPIF